MPTRMPRVDSHHHFWKYNAEEYGWISDSMGLLRRDFLPKDLKREMDGAGIDAVVSVQARQTLAETKFLLEMAEQNPFILGVVGWAPLTDRNIGGILEQLAVNRKLKGLRHVLQDEADDQYVLREDFNNGIEAVHKFGLVYDILIYERHLPQTIRFVDRHPGQVFVLDHIAKPRIKDRILSPWREHIKELAKRPNVFCKVSGMVTEADWKGWTEADLKPYFDTVLEAFEPRRLMFGSDWPVCLVASGYKRWVDVVSKVIAPLSELERVRIMGGTAVEVYGL